MPLICYAGSADRNLYKLNTIGNELKYLNPTRLDIAFCYLIHRQTGERSLGINNYNLKFNCMQVLNIIYVIVNAIMKYITLLLTKLFNIIINEMVFDAAVIVAYLYLIADMMPTKIFTRYLRYNIISVNYSLNLAIF